jgi:hypothetical protein
MRNPRSDAFMQISAYAITSTNSTMIVAVLECIKVFNLAPYYAELQNNLEKNAFDYRLTNKIKHRFSCEF